MLKTAMLALIGAGVAGCSEQVSVSNPFGNTSDTVYHQHLAAFAANSKYPSSQPSDDLRAVALVSRGNKTLRLVNASDQAMRDVKIWVNGSFVSRIDTVPPKGIVTLQRGDFFDSNGTSLSNVDATVNKVQIEAPNHFYNVEGPVFE